MYEVIHLDNNVDYLQYVPYDIIAVDESFHKLYDRKNRMFQYDDHNDLPLELLFNCAEKDTWEDVMNNGDWLKIESSIRNGSIVIRRFIHKSIEEEYLKRTNGLLKWYPEFIYEIIVNKHRVTLTSNNYMDYSPRKMIAFASLYSGVPYYEIIDEYGGWFYLDTIMESEVQKVFPNYNEFTFGRDDTFFHMGLGTGMWVDKSIVEPFSKEAERIYSDGMPPLPDGTKKRWPRNLYPVWREVVWGIINDLGTNRYGKRNRETN